MERRYAVLDVFCNQPLAGNPLAIVLDGAGFNDEMMQSITSEFNLSETVFVTSIDRAKLSADIRIFTPGQELPFAGHPTVGTAIYLATEVFTDEAGSSGQVIDLVLQEKVGPVKCQVKIDADRKSAEFVLPKLPEIVGETGADESVALALGLSVSDIGFDAHKPQQWSAGVPYSLVPVSSINAIGRVSPNMSAWRDAFGTGHHNNAFVYCRECEDAGHQFHARMFWPGAGVSEDAATGSAVAAFAGAIVQNENLIDGMHTITIEQGYEMGRPSLIDLVLNIENNALVEAKIGGDAVVLAQGTLLLPD